MKHSWSIKTPQIEAEPSRWRGRHRIRGKKPYCIIATPLPTFQAESERERERERSDETPTDCDCVTPRKIIKEHFAAATEDLVERSEWEERERERINSVEISSVLTAAATADIFTGGGAIMPSFPSFVRSVGHAVIGNFRCLSNICRVMRIE